MKRILIPLSGVVLIIFVVLLLPQLLPSNAGPAGLYVLLLLMDVYLWLSFKETLKKTSRPVAVILGLFYWLPSLLMGGAALAMLAEHFGFWNQTVRIWLFAFVGISYASKILPAIFLLLSDFFRVVNWLFLRAFTNKTQPRPQWHQLNRSRFLRYIGLLGGGLIFSSMLAGMIRWVYDFRIHRVKIPLHGIGKAFNGYKIVQISDLHLGSWSSTEPLDEVVAIIKSLKADLVVFTGDLVNYHTGETKPFGPILKKIKPPDGVLAVLGNHDYGNYVTWESDDAKRQNMDDLYSFFHEIGWRLLNNETVVIKRDGDSMAVTGVENWGANPRFPKRGDLQHALKDLDEQIEARILLSHDPTHWQHIVSKSFPSIGLTLSGHTHGMQMGYEGKNFRWSPAQYVYRYWAGLYKHPATDQYLYVNRGLGHIGYPGRIGIRPEITLIELAVGG